MKSKKTKKMAYGGKSLNIETPSEAMEKYNRNTLYASVKSDEKALPWEMAGGALFGLGTSLATAGISNLGGFNSILAKEGKDGSKFGKVLDSLLGIAATQSKLKVANGGTINRNKVEAEGKEIMQIPGYAPVELVGPSHEEGGIDLNVPDGTDFYSKRVKGADGKTMAERKKKREKEIARLEKLVKQNPHDKNLKRTLEKVKANFEYLDNEDLDKMNFIQNFTEGIQKFASGGTKNPYGYNKKGVFYELPDYLNPDLTLGMMTPNETVKSLNLSMSKPDIPTVSAPLKQTEKNSSFNIGKNLDLKLGDLIGLGGQLYSAFKPMQNTKEARATDKPNINHFKNYGKEGLKTLDQSKQYVNQVRDENLRDLELSRNGLIDRNRNSARGINTLRALDLATDATVNNSKSQVYNQFAQMMQQILGQEAQLKMQQDQAVMQGEQNRDLADRQDKDAYYTQLAQDIATKGTGLQHIGKNINEIVGRKDKYKHLDEQLGLMKEGVDYSIYRDNLLKSLGYEDEDIQALKALKKQRETKKSK